MFYHGLWQSERAQTAGYDTENTSVLPSYKVIWSGKRKTSVRLLDHLAIWLD
jgi:hypothetical protein